MFQPCCRGDAVVQLSADEGDQYTMCLACVRDQYTVAGTAL